jgi:hypothetical protein
MADAGIGAQMVAVSKRDARIWVRKIIGHYDTWRRLGWVVASGQQAGNH